MLLAAPALVRILGTCPEATVQTLDQAEALGSLAQAIRVQQRDGLPPDLWLPEAPPPVSALDMKTLVRLLPVQPVFLWLLRHVV